MNIAKGFHVKRKGILHSPEDTRPPSQYHQPSSFLSSLRSRGYIFVALVLLYILLISTYFFSQRMESLEQVEQYQLIQQTQAALVQADLASFHVVTALYSDVTMAELNQVISYFSKLGQQYQDLTLLFPQQAEAFRQLKQTIPVISEYRGEDDLSKIHLYLLSSKNQLDRLMRINQERMTRMIDDYRRHNDSLLFKTLLLALVGLVLIGFFTIFFFSRLKSDLLDLNQRTAEIVKGYRGEPLPVNRQDEVGQLTKGINLMSQALDEREKALEIGRRKYSFKEKMLAIDSLAGGIAHEVGNPITCIKGLALEISDDPDTRLSENSKGYLRQLHHYTDSLARFIQDLSSIDLCKDDKNEWVSINSLLSNTTNLYRYDQRRSKVKIALDLDKNLPAIFASLEQLNQLIMLILENSFDAIDNQPNPNILVQTAVETQNNILLIIQDNGIGVGNQDLQRIFEPFYTTKPVGYGTGLGLAICWAIITSYHGSIEAEAPSEGGFKLIIRLPVNQASAN